MRSSLVVASGCALVLAVALGGCAAAPTAAPVTPPADSFAAGIDAEEIAEPQRSLVLATTDGAVTLVDVATGDERALTNGIDSDTGPATTALASDGRFAFHSLTVGDDTTVQVIDTGVWTEEHGDHFHYFRTEPRVIDTLSGTGPASIHSADKRTAITFAATGDVTVLAHSDLADGTLGDAASATIEPHPSARAVPFAGGLLVTGPDAAGTAATVTALSADETPLATAPCPGNTGATVTRVGVVFACATGAVLATVFTGEVSLDHIAYPAGGAEPATAFDGRRGRPAVAGVAGDHGVWRLDTRQRAWAYLATDTPVLAASAISDDANRTVGVDAAGRVLFLDAHGAVLAASAAVVTPTDDVQLRVDVERAYALDTARGQVLEIDDAGTVTQTLPAANAALIELVG